MKKITLFFISLFLVFMTVSSQTVNIKKNPYANVNWSTYIQYKANFHTHTTNSDGSQTPSTVINEYYTKGYKILAITDHNYTTWPWPSNPGMLAVRGNEFSNSHHMNGFINFTLTSTTLENGIPNVQTNNGMSMINHPGRYNTPSNWSWYIPWYRDYSTCGTLEVYNQGDRYSSDRQLWDNINQNLFPSTGKMVWGVSNDDKHTTSHLYGNFNFMLMPDLTESSFRTSMTSGAFYFCYEPGKTGNANVPRISNIVVDNNAKTITITGSGYTSIQWIGPGTTQVGTGTTFNYSSYTDKAFVRAILISSSGRSYTQPFGFETLSGGNTPPTCSITSPLNGATFTDPASITINANAADADGSVTKVEFFQGSTKLGEDLTSPYSFNWSNVAAGNYTLTVKATDNEGAVTTSSSVNVSVSVDGAISVSRRIATGMDDVEEAVSGAVYTNSSDMELVYDSYNSAGNQTVGLRFTNLNIPQGATIVSASIQFTCDETSSSTTNLTIRGHAADNSAAFTTSTSNVSSRTKTTASVSWSPSSWNTVGEAGANQRTPDMSSVIQEIVNRTGFSSSSAISIIITGTGARIAEAYEGSSSQAALLSIEYTTTGTSNTPPTCSITSPANNATFTAPANITITANAADADGSVAKVEFFQGTTKLGEDLTSPYSFTWSNVAAGNYSLTVKATDNEGAVTTSSAVAITVNASGTTPIVVSRRIATGMDDVEQNKNGGIYTNSSDIELVYDGSTRGNQTIGLRFTNLNIPQGATISKAYIQFTCDERKTGSTSVTIRGEASNNSAAFTTSTNNVSNRTKTSASVAWNSIPSWSTVGAAGANERTPELKTIVQEIVNRSGFTNSSAMTFIITGTGTRTAEAYEGSSSKAPLLYIEYTTSTLKSANAESVLAKEEIVIDINTNEASSNESVFFYPNPTTGEINLELNGEKSTVSVYNLSGKVLLNFETSNVTERINIHNFENGLYILEVIQGNERKSFKIIKD